MNRIQYYSHSISKPAKHSRPNLLNNAQIGNNSNSINDTTNPDQIPTHPLLIQSGNIYPLVQNNISQPTLVDPKTGSNVQQTGYNTNVMNQSTNSLIVSQPVGL